MSTAEILSLVSLISYIVAGVCLVLAVFFWFFFKIPVIIGDLSGRTAKKSIEKMRQSNEQSGHKTYRSSVTNAARGKITDTMPGSEKLKKTTAETVKPAAPTNAQPETGVLNENRAEVVYSEETAALNVEEATTLLVSAEETTALNVEQVPVKRAGGKKLTMINEVMLISTDEVIA